MSLNTYSEIPNWLYLGKPVYTKEIIDSYSSIPNVQAYPVIDSEIASPVNVNSYASASPVTRRAPPVRSYISSTPTTTDAAPVRDIIPSNEMKNLIDVPSALQQGKNRYIPLFSQDVLRSYTIYIKNMYPSGFVRLGKLTKIEKSPGNGENLFYFSEKNTPYRDTSYFFYDPNEFVGKLSKGGKKTRKNKRK